MRYSASLDIDIAKKYGLPEAFVHSWVEEYCRVHSTLREGQESWYLYDRQHMLAILPFFSDYQIEKAFKKLVEAKRLKLMEEENEKFYSIDVPVKKPRAKRGEGKVVVQEGDTITYVRTHENGKEEIVNTTMGKLVGELIHEFRHINPDYRTFYAQPRFRKPLEEMIKDQFSIDQMFKLLAVIPQTNQMPFAPIITNPAEFKRSSAKLIAFVQRKQQEKKPGVKITL